MLYIEKRACPSDVAAKIEVIKQSDAWMAIPDLPDPQLPQSEKQAAAQSLRYCFEELDKNCIREYLLAEQHYLCAYCMLPIKNDPLHTTIEHWYPLSESKAYALDYNNFLATCQGGRDVEGITRKQRVLCCDAQKGNASSVCIDPRNKEMMKGIIYSSEGIIGYKDTPSFNASAICKDIDNVLQLNGKLDDKHFCIRDTATQLVKQRKDVYQNTETICLDLLANGELTIEWLETKIAKCLEQTQREKLAGVVVFVYSMYLERLKNKAGT